MINSVFILNNQGKPRLCKFYEHLVSAGLVVACALDAPH